MLYFFNTLLILLFALLPLLVSPFNSKWFQEEDGQTSPTVKARLNRAGFDFFSQSGRKIVSTEIPKIEIPTITIEITGGPGHGKVSAEGLKVKKFDSPHFNFSLIEPDKLRWKTRGGTVKIVGDWNAEYTILIPIALYGKVKALASDIQVEIEASVYADQGRPQVTVDDCAAAVIDLDIDISGGVLPWIVNLFKAPLAKAIKKAIHNQACVAARNVLLEQINDFLLTLPIHVPIGKNFYVDYAIKDTPVVTKTYAQARAYADVVYGNTSCTIQPKPINNNTGSQPHMVNVWIAEQVPNCLLSSAHSGQLLDYTVTKDLSEVANYLKTSCSVFHPCIGLFFPDLKKRFPNSYVDLHFHSAKAPIILFLPGQVNLSAFFEVDFHINPRAKHPTVLARLGLNASSTLIPRLNHSRVVADLNQTDLSFKEVFSTIGDFSDKFLHAFAEVFKVSAKVVVDVALKHGLPIPVFENITLASDRSQVVVDKDVIRVDANFEYETNFTTKGRKNGRKRGL